jgi:hypothetical protein
LEGPLCVWKSHGYNFDILVSPKAEVLLKPSEGCVANVIQEDNKILTFGIIRMDRDGY